MPILTNQGARKLLVTAALAATFTGCTSVSSTYFHRDEEDARWKKNHIKGIPITLDVPTHVRFSILETTYVVSRVDPTAAAKADASAKVAAAAVTASKAAPADTAKAVEAQTALVTATADADAAAKKLELVMLDATRPLKTYNVTYDFITEKKIFGVDFKRPAAGPFSLTANLANQYFTSVDHRLTDQTIEKTGTAINTLIAQLVPTGGIPSGKAKSALSEGVQAPASTPIPINSLKCSQVFKLDAPDFEIQVAAFLSEHCCSTATEKAMAISVPPAGAVPPQTQSPSPFAPGVNPGEQPATPPPDIKDVENSHVSERSDVRLEQIAEIPPGASLVAPAGVSPPLRSAVPPPRVYVP